MDSLLGHIERNWDVIKTAPMPFVILGALTFLGGFALASHNSSQLVATLEERIKLKDDQLAKESSAWQQEFLEKRREQPDGTLPIMVGREFEVFYQGGKKVGQALVPPTLQGLGLLDFDSVRLEKGFDQYKLVEYNDLILKAWKATKVDGTEDHYSGFFTIEGHRN